MLKTNNNLQKDILNFLNKTDSRVIAVSRHPGAILWLKEKLPAHTIFVKHLENSFILKGDIVVGTLPLHTIERVCSSQGQYFHLNIVVPENLRGKELSIEQLEKLGSTLKAYDVKTVENISSFLAH